MKITYGITVCNEFIEIQRLISFLLQHKRVEDNIVVLFDEANGDPEIETFLRTHSINGEFLWVMAKFNGHFADWKNKLTSLCSGDYIFQIDADELPSETLIQQLPNILTTNNTVDVMLVPRVNTVTGLTDQHVAKWGWNVNEAGWVNWPDYQWRIYKNNGTVSWKNQVHEVLDGFSEYAPLPAYESLALYHPKTIERQERQNNYYATL